MNNSTFTKQKVRPSYLDKSNFQYTYISQYAFEYLEYKMSLTLNNLEKRNERNLWNANADPLYHFIENCIIEVEDSKKTKRETYKFYEQWCWDNGIKPLGKGQFGKEFGIDFEDLRDGRWYWLDIDFKVPTQETLNEVDEQ